MPYSFFTVTAPAEFDGVLLMRHIKSETGYDMFKRYGYNLASSKLKFVTTGLPAGAEAAITAAVGTYVHPVDVGAERTTLDAALGR